MSDAQSLIAAYLQSKGMPFTGENSSRALQMNAQQPGLIPGLVNMATETGQQPAPGIERAMGNGVAPQQLPLIGTPPAPPATQAPQLGQQAPNIPVAGPGTPPAPLASPQDGNSALSDLGLNAGTLAQLIAGAGGLGYLGYQGLKPGGLFPNMQGVAPLPSSGIEAGAPEARAAIEGPKNVAATVDNPLASALDKATDTKGPTTSKAIEGRGRQLALPAPESNGPAIRLPGPDISGPTIAIPADVPPAHIAAIRAELENPGGWGKLAGLLKTAGKVAKAVR